MDQTQTPLDLAAIGRELDRARQSRISRSRTTTNDLESVSESEKSSSSSKSSPSVDIAPLPSVREEQPYPTCILCFTRPPSAVLLPCCHLNLCYLCAPLLLLKQCRRAPRETTTAPGPDISHRNPFSLALMKATANHPKSRRLSTGGYTAPPDGSRGGEIKAKHVAEACEERGMHSGLEGHKGDDGRISLSTSPDGDEGGGDAKCLVCRAAVHGWLRVYTG